MRPDEFIAAYKPYAARAAQALGMPVGVVMAQWALETATGESELATAANNLGGIKYMGQDEAAGPYGAFAAYPSISAFTDDYIRVLSIPGYGYPAVKAAQTPDDTIKALQRSQYAEEGYAGLPGLYRESYAVLDRAPGTIGTQAPSGPPTGNGAGVAGVAVVILAALALLVLLVVGGGEDHG